ncbi:MAG TPA: trigger factor [Steroidobacteraceae bacterium]|nr:trigger factor [Steroidobacteraceae bacterium]
MQVSVESIGKLERRMQVQVPAEQVSRQIATRLKELSRTARLKGFRPGKAPITVIRQQFGQQVHREVIGELMQSSFSEAVTQNRLSPAGSPRIEPKSVAEGEDLTYVATFEVFPEVALQPLSALAVERLTADVTEADVDAMVQRLRTQQMKYTAVARPAANGDKVSVDFAGTIEGKPFAGGQGENVAIVLGARRMLEQLEEGLVGAGAGESREIGVDFPADYRAAELAGRRAVFKVDVKSVEEPSLPELDEEFCASFGVTEGGVPRLREDVAANMRRELEQTLRNRNKAQVMEKLYQANPIDVPNALLETQVQELQLEAMRRTGAKDVSQAPPREPLIEPARRRVALGLLVNEIVRREKIVLDPARSNARLDEMVGSYGDAAALKRAYLQNAQAMRQVENLALEDQVVDFILERAQVHEMPRTFKELMNFDG